jgi:hypothetical protein
VAPAAGMCPSRLDRSAKGNRPRAAIREGPWLQALGSVAARAFVSLDSVAAGFVRTKTFM